MLGLGWSGRRRFDMDVGVVVVRGGRDRKEGESRLGCQTPTDTE